MSALPSASGPPAREDKDSVRTDGRHSLQQQVRPPEDSSLVEWNM